MLFIFILLCSTLILRFKSSIYLCNTLIVHGLTFILFFLVSDVVAPPPIAIEGVNWTGDGPKFAYRVDGCDASYTTKYNLVQHL